jgi:hypothetical protein
MEINGIRAEPSPTPRLKRGVNTKAAALSNIIFRRFQVVEIRAQSL